MHSLPISYKKEATIRFIHVKVSEYDQEIPQSYTADKPVVP